MDGWIKLHRKLVENPLYFSESFTRTQAWIDLLIIANHNSGFFYKRGIRVNVNRGQIGYDLDSLGKRWKWSRGKVERFINELEKDNQIVRQKNNVTTLISIVNYEIYQADSKAKDKANNKADGHQTVKQTIKQTEANNKNKEEEKKDNNVEEEKPPSPEINIFKEGVFVSINVIFNKTIETKQFRDFAEKQKLTINEAKISFQEFIDYRKSLFDDLINPKDFWKHFTENYKKRKNGTSKNPKENLRGANSDCSQNYSDENMQW